MHLADDAAMAGGMGGMDSARNDQDAVDLAALTRALDAGQVDVAVHWLQLLLFRKEDGDQPPQEHRKVLAKRSRRLRTIQSAVTQMLNDCDKNDAGDGLTLRPGLASREAGASCELSYSQLQMFALHALQPASTAYNVVRALQFNSGVSLDLEALECTCNALMAKHEALRTCFDNTGGQPKQTVYPVSHFRGGLAVFGVVQTELLSPSNSDKELAAAVAKVADEPFDLTRQAPIRMYAFVSPDHSLTSPWAIAVVLHHIVTDAASSQLFWKDFHELYARFVRNGDAKTMGPGYVKQLEVDASESSRLTYRDFAVWQRARMRSGIIAPQLQYWTYQLTSGGVPPLLELPFDMGDIKTPSSDSSAELNTPKATTTTGDIVVFRSTPALQKAFSALCHAQGASMFMGLLAVFHLLVERLSGQQDFVIGAPSSGRGSSDVEDVMGYFVNTLPLRLGTKCTGKETFKDFLMIVREVVLGAYNNMEIPFHKVLEHLRASAHSSHDVDDDAKRRWQHPLFQIMFSWEQSNSDEPLGDSSMNDYTELSLPHQSAKFDLMLSMRHRHLKGPSADRVLEGSMEYPTARFTRDTIKRFTSYYLELLEQVTRTPSALVRSPSICMLSDSERRQLVSKWGMPKPPASSSYLVQKPSSQFLDECLFSQAQRTPQHIALHFEGSQWTYKDLWSNSVRIAQALTMLDIPGDATELHVGLLLDRGLENVAAMVGTLHLKGVFVPLDPEFPRERLRYMAHDSCLQVIITQQKHASIAKDLSISAARDSGDDDDLLPCVLCYEDVEILTSQFESSHNESRLLRQHSHDAHSAPAYILYTSGVRLCWSLLFY
ncbi:unnamed protein product [Phytophthora lilii]|uniref:Unnamed protein product n=1 Tax=Phytophthora lilii TaxID=2077276 RepID=A0A9W7D7L2_9STRA|nr:unnamed protein product [Phytophthora lilii]